MDTRQAQIERMLDERAINEILTRYTRAADHFDLELMRSCYWPGAYDWHGTFRGTIEEFIPWVEGRLNEYSTTRHHITNMRVEFDENPDHALVDSYVLAYHNMLPPDEHEQLFLGLRYIDRMERRDGEWRIGERVCAYDWRTFARGTEEGLTEAHIRGSRGADDPINWIMGRKDQPGDPWEHSQEHARGID